MSLPEKVSRLPLVSVVVPTHNRKTVVTRCVESVLRSSYSRIEIIVVDDESTDGTFHHLSTLFPNVELVRLQRKQMLSASRNVGCKYTRGEFVFLVDDDNVVHPDAVAELVNAISDNPYAGIGDRRVAFAESYARELIDGFNPKPYGS